MINIIKNDATVSKLQQRNDSIKVKDNTTVIFENQDKKEDIKKLEKEIQILKISMDYSKNTGFYPNCGEEIPFLVTGTIGGILGGLASVGFISKTATTLSLSKTLLGAGGIVTVGIAASFGAFKYIMSQKKAKAAEEMENELKQKEQQLTNLKNGVVV